MVVAGIPSGGAVVGLKGGSPVCIDRHLIRSVPAISNITRERIYVGLGVVQTAVGLLVGVAKLEWVTACSLHRECIHKLERRSNSGITAHTLDLRSKGAAHNLASTGKIGAVLGRLPLPPSPDSLLVPGSLEDGLIVVGRSLHGIGRSGCVGHEGILARVGEVDKGFVDIGGIIPFGAVVGGLEELLAVGLAHEVVVDSGSVLAIVQRRSLHKGNTALDCHGGTLGGAALPVSGHLAVITDVDRELFDCLIELTEDEIEALFHRIAFDAGSVGLEVGSHRFAIRVHPDIDRTILTDETVIIVCAEELGLSLHLLLDKGKLFGSFVVVFLHQVDVVDEHRTLRDGLIEFAPRKEACGSSYRGSGRVVTLAEREVVHPHSPGELGLIGAGFHPTFAVTDGFVFGDE